jgi:hypothetical protein
MKWKKNTHNCTKPNKPNPKISGPNPKISGIGGANPFAHETDKILREARTQRPMADHTTASRRLNAQYACGNAFSIIRSWKETTRKYLKNELKRLVASQPWLFKLDMELDRAR